MSAGISQNKVIELCQTLIRFQSDTSKAPAPLEYIAQRLSSIGMSTEFIHAGEIPNLYAETKGEGPLFVYVGHTDVVPAGPLEKWSYPPYEAQIANGRIYGRGASDMKGSVAAFVVALEDFVATVKSPSFRIGVLLAGDEETTAVGTPAVLRHLHEQKKRIEWCLVGEPTSRKTLGDTIKPGRRGAVTGKFSVKGIQGHAAYPHLARNPIHEMTNAIMAIISSDFDAGLPSSVASENDEGWPTTSFQVVEIHGGVGATNVIPGEVKFTCNIRFRAPHTKPEIMKRVEGFFQKHCKEYSVQWSEGCIPYDSKPGILCESIEAAVQKSCGFIALRSRDGGTSDGRFVAQTGAEVIECGPVNETVHQIDENLLVEELEKTAVLFREVLQQLHSRNAR